MATDTSSRRSDCPIGYALDIFGDRWTLLVLRDILIFGKRHFGTLLAAGEGIASNTLADRLRRLEDENLIHRAIDAADRRRAVYLPTERGISLVPLLVDMAAWGLSDSGMKTGPKNLLARYRADRDGLIAGYVSQARAALSDPSASD